MQREEVIIENLLDNYLYENDGIDAEYEKINEIIAEFYADDDEIYSFSESENESEVLPANVPVPTMTVSKKMGRPKKYASPEQKRDVRKVYMKNYMETYNSTDERKAVIRAISEEKKNDPRYKQIQKQSQTKTYYCACCNYTGAFANRFNHEKTVKHQKNSVNV